MLLRFVLALVLGLALVFHPSHKSLAKSPPSICDQKEQKEHEVMGPLTVKTPDIVNIHLKTTYIDGISIVKVVNDHFISAEDVIAKYDGWKMAKCGQKDVFLHKKVDDLSPISKTAGIMGLKDGKILTLYNGKPEERHIIQTFFQIDVNALEASAKNQLQKGIRISDKKQYDSILQSLEKFAVKMTPNTVNQS